LVRSESRMRTTVTTLPFFIPFFQELGFQSAAQPPRNDQFFMTDLWAIHNPLNNCEHFLSAIRTCLNSLGVAFLLMGCSRAGICG
jgi:hypothetical protein